MNVCPCYQCGCTGNKECTYPPEGEVDCSLDDQMVCRCCGKGINRMKYRPEEDGQIEMEGT